MKKKILGLALLGGLAMAQSAAAQEFDDRWYISGSAGFNLQDNDRRIHEELFELLRIPSVSARSEHAADVRRAA